MLGDDKNVKEKRGHNITLGVKKYILRNEMRKYYYYTTSHGGNRLGWESKSDDVIWKAIRMEWRLPTTVRVF